MPFFALNHGLFINLWPWFAGFFSRRIYLCICFRAELQIETTQDYATDSWFLNVFTGSFSEQDMPTGLFTFVFITSSSSKIISLFCHNLKFKFCCQSFDVIFPPKTVKIEKQKHRIFWNTKFYHPTKFEFKRIKYENIVPAVTQQQFRSKDTISHVAWKLRGDVKRSKARLLYAI